MCKNKNAFTLIELIVVITILAILGTIAFISLQGYSQDSRDAVRISDMNNVKIGLSLFQIKSSHYPIPDDYVTITASGVEILYQGYIGEGVSRIIDINKIVKDPLDDEKYIYSTDYSRTKFQILSYMEGSDVISLSNDYENLSFFINRTNATKDYSKRYLKVFGDNLGILLNTGTLDPIKENIDIEQTNNTYRAIIDNDKYIEGTGSKLITLKDTNKGFFYKFISAGDFSFGGKNYSILWNKKELPLSYEEKLNFSYDIACGTEKKLADLGNFDNTNFSDIIDKISEVLYVKYGYGASYGSGALKNVQAYFAQTGVLSASPVVSISAKIFKNKYVVFTGNTCSYPSNYTTSSYPCYMSGATETESYMGNIVFSNYASPTPLASMQGNNIYFGPMYGSQLYPYVFKGFTLNNASINQTYDYVSSACASWNTSMGAFPYGYLKLYSGADKVFTLKSLEYGLRNDYYYNIALGKTLYEQNLSVENFKFGNLILCSD